MSTSGRCAVVLAGGPGPVVVAPGSLPERAFVVAADSGLSRAASLGLRVDVVVGDMDSVDAADLAAARSAGARIEQHPRMKDATDLELAVEAARSAGATEVFVVAGDAGRFDHTMGNVLLLASDAFADLAVRAVIGAAQVAVVRKARSVALQGATGSLVSLLAVGGVARGIVTEGLLYPLRGEELLPGTSRGISNELVAERARVSLESGVLLAIQPG